jgi:hypothetical protein
MHAHLLAGIAQVSASAPKPAPTILVFDSGLGGLTVFAEVARARPDARFVYAADDAGFPYGRFAEGALAERVTLVLERLIERHAPDLVIVACNTASTVDVVLPHLRRRFAVPIVGTVPPIKPAAALSRSGLVSILATSSRRRRSRASRSATTRFSTRLGPPSSRWTAGAPTWSASAAPITPCCSLASSASRLGRWRGSIRLRRWLAESCSF